MQQDILVPPSSRTDIRAKGHIKHVDSQKSHERPHASLSGDVWSLITTTSLHNLKMRELEELKELARRAGEASVENGEQCLALSRKGCGPSSADPSPPLRPADRVRDPVAGHPGGWNVEVEQQK
jgi:hypothetical protein